MHNHIHTGLIVHQLQGARTWYSMVQWGLTSRSTHCDTMGQCGNDLPSQPVT